MNNNIMLDLETMDNNSTSAIIAIGAVKFERTVTDKFYRKVSLASSMASGLTVSADTIMWWMKQNDAARLALSKNVVLLQQALIDFSNWIDKDAKIWGNGASFDNVILKNAYQKCFLPVPWKYWNDRCYRTIKAMYPAIPYTRTGTYHNAADDAETQANHLIQILYPA